MKTAMQYAVTIMFCVLWTSGLKAGVTVTGRVLSYNGTPVEQTYVYPASMEQSKGVVFMPGKFIKTDKDGYFSYTSPVSSPFVIYITAAYHEPFLLLVDSKNSKELHYEIKMARYFINKDGPFFILGDFNSFLPGKIPMKEIKPGFFQAEVATKKDSFAYLIKGLNSYLNLPGQEGTLSRFNNIGVKNGYFITKVKTTGEKTMVSLDINKYPTGIDKVQITVNDSSAEAVAMAFLEFDRMRNIYFREYMTHLGSGKNEDAFKYDWAELENKNKNRILLRKHLEIETFIYMAIGRMNAPVDTFLINKALTEVGPESAYWQIYTAAIKWYEIIYDHDKAMHYLDLLYRENNYAKIKAAALFYIIELRKNYNQPYENYYQQLQTDFPESSFAESAKDKYNPESVFAKGKKIPAFIVKLLEGDTYFDTRQLKKNYYIIDFWATWCAPCIAGLPELEELYAKYKNSGFEIVSISLDKSIETVEKFREKKFAMPWLHAVLDRGYKDPLMTSLSITTLPRIVLIDSKGVIIGADDDLRNGKLDVLFSSILNGSYKN